MPVNLKELRFPKLEGILCPYILNTSAEQDIISA